ncbi:MAG TPA: ABC transporter permease [Acidimicrobiales bacterium]|nr:ABC transporter permease [Acidimicrobiales bacterium]
MIAIGLWVRTTTRRYLRATIFLVIVAGLSSAVVASSVQAARRSGDAVDRYFAQSRLFDTGISACPPGVDPDSFRSAEDYLEQCSVDDYLEYQRVLEALPAVEAAAVGTTDVVALLDETAPNGWGRIGLAQQSRTDGVAIVAGKPILVAGRVPEASAADEFVLGEAAARMAGIEAGDVVRIASWRQVDLDAGVDGRIPPQTEPIEGRVVGIVRFLDDLQPSQAGSIDGTALPSFLYMPPGWYDAHPEPAATYGGAAVVRLREGPGAVDEFGNSIDGVEGWLAVLFPLGDVDVPSIRRVVDTERRAVLVFAGIAGTATLCFVGLALVRQLRREFAEAATLAALGFTSRDLRVMAVCRTLVIAGPAALLAVIATIGLSWFVPVGLARNLEFDTGIRFDAVALGGVFVLVPLWCVVLAAIVAARVGRRSSVAAPVGPSRVTSTIGRRGAVPAAGISFTRGGSSRAAVGVTATAVAAIVAAGCLVGSLDRVLDQPERYGAWWDVAVGQYSNIEPFEEGVALLKEIPGVRTAAGFYNEEAVVDDVAVPMNASVDIIGRHTPVVASGRAPMAREEIALGRETAHRLDKGIGDEVTIGLNLAGTEPLETTATVVGIAVISNPISAQRAAGDGIYVSPSFLESLEVPFAPQSIAVEIDPRADRAATMSALTSAFSGSMRGAEAQADLANLARLRTVPWLVAALLAVLALTTVVHALVTIVHRHRGDLAVLAAMGLTPGQLRVVAAVTGSAIVGAGLVVGVPLGVVVGRVVWRALADEISIPSGPAHSWVVPAMVVGIGLLLGNIVTAFVSRRSSAQTTADALHVE